MFSHFTLGSNNLNRSVRFYTPTLAALEISKIETDPSWPMHGYSPADGDFPHLFIVSPQDGLPATWSNGFHLAFNTATTAVVDRFHAVAIASGGVDAGVPGLRPEYAKDYYGAYVRDPAGNKLHAVCRAPA